MSERDISKLPKWAQTKILNLMDRNAYLQQDLRRLKAQLEPIVTGTQEETKTRARTMRDEIIYLPDTVDVRWTLGDRWDHFIEISRGEDCIKVYAGGPIAVNPLVSNSIDITLRSIET